MFYKKIVLFISIFLSYANLSAHEMWIEPINYQLSVNDKILAHEKVGQDFKGNKYSYLSSSYKKLRLTLNGKTRDITSRIGDMPAIHENVEEEGLVILSAITTPSDLKYKTWEKFESFISSKGLDWVIKAHHDRKLPEKNFTEMYSRYPKSLVKVGHGKGQDKALGMPIEWVAESNPYTDNSAFIALRLLWQGKPFTHAHLDVFNRINNELIKTSLTTDNNGRVKIPRANGGKFLINAVQMIIPKESDSASTDAVWESLWASMTFELKQ